MFTCRSCTVATVAAGLFLSSLLAGAAYGVAAVRGAHVTDRRHGHSPCSAPAAAAVAAMQWLGRYDLAFAQNGFVTGVTPRMRKYGFPGRGDHGINGHRRGRARGLAVLNRARLARRAVIVGGTWYVALLVAGAVLPLAYQKLIVAPARTLPRRRTSRTTSP